MQSSELDRRASNLHRLHYGERGHPPGSTDVDLNVEQSGVDFFGRVFVGNGPPWSSGGRTKPSLQICLVDFDNQAVDVMHHIVAVLPDVIDMGFDILHVFEDFGVFASWQPPGGQRFICLRLLLNFEAFDGTNSVANHCQRPLGRFGPVFLPQ